MLKYPKFDLSKKEIEAILEEEVLPYLEVTETTEEVTICRDSHDDKFLSCAVSADAGFIISGDKDLTDIKSYKTVKIITASDLIHMFTDRENKR